MWIKTYYHLVEVVNTILPINLEMKVKLGLRRNDITLLTSYSNSKPLFITKIFIYLKVFLYICIYFKLHFLSFLSMGSIPEVY
jgi:hypothetical protein